MLLRRLLFSVIVSEVSKGLLALAQRLNVLNPYLNEKNNNNFKFFNLSTSRIWFSVELFFLLPRSKQILMHICSSLSLSRLCSFEEKSKLTLHSLKFKQLEGNIFHFPSKFVSLASTEACLPLYELYYKNSRIWKYIFFSTLGARCSCISGSAKNLFCHTSTFITNSSSFHKNII